MSKIDKIEELQNIIKQDSTNSTARRQLAILLVDVGFNEEALQNFLYLLKHEEDEELYYNLGIVYEKLKNTTKAQESYEKAIKLNPNFDDAIYNLGLVYTQIQEYDKSIECFEKILEPNSDDENTYFNLGLAYFKKNDLIKALDNFQSAIDINDEDIYAHFYIGNIYKEFGDLASAKTKFEKVIELSPDYSWAYYNLAVIYNEENNIEKVIRYLQLTIEKNSQDIEAYILLIRAYANIKRYKEAKQIIDLALANCEETGDLDYLAGKIYKYSGDIETCSRYFTKALKNRQTLTVPLKFLK